MVVHIIDYGVGNILSITNALDYLGYKYKVSNKKEELMQASAFILPGVGAFPEAMQNLHNLDLVTFIKYQVQKMNKPILGICLGMQVLAEDSQENGFCKGLSLLPGYVVRITTPNYRVPHVGWNDVQIKRKYPLFSSIGDNMHFYFDHSYQFITTEQIIAATCDYGGELTAAVQQRNIFGVQFHPEKSQNNGLRLYRGFMEDIKNAKR